MESQNAYSWLTDSFLKLFGTLHPERKRELLAKMHETTAVDQGRNQSEFWKSYGGWQGRESSDQIIKEIKSTRNFSRST